MRKVYKYVYIMSILIVNLITKSVLILGGIILGSFSFLFVYLYVKFMRSNIGTFIYDLEYILVVLFGLLCLGITVATILSLDKSEE